MINKYIKFLFVIMLSFASTMCAKSYDSFRSNIEYANSPQEIGTLAKSITDSEHLDGEEKAILLARLAKHTIALATELLDKAYNHQGKEAKAYINESWAYIKENKNLLIEADPDDYKALIKEFADMARVNLFKGF